MGARCSAERASGSRQAEASLRFGYKPPDGVTDRPTGLKRELNMADDTKQTTEQAANTGENGSTGNSESQAEQQQEEQRIFTQADLDALISKRLARERKAWESAAEEERKKLEMTEGDRLKAEKAEAEKRAAESTAAANARILKTEARAALADAGVRSERRDYALRMLDLSDISMGDDGEPDPKALKAAVEALLSDIPELKGGGGATQAGADMRGNAGQPNPETMSMSDYMAWRKKQT